MLWELRNAGIPYVVTPNEADAHISLLMHQGIVWAAWHLLCAAAADRLWQRGEKRWCFCCGMSGLAERSMESALALLCCCRSALAERRKEVTAEELLLVLARLSKEAHEDHLCCAAAARAPCC